MAPSENLIRQVEVAHVYWPQEPSPARKPGGTVKILGSFLLGLDC